MGRNFKWFCRADGMVGIAFAAGMLVMPAELMQLYGLQLDAPAALFVRATAAILLGCSVIILAIRNSPPSRELTTFLGCFGFADLLLGTIFLTATHSGLMNAMGYGLAAVCIAPGALFLIFAHAGTRLMSAQARS